MLFPISNVPIAVEFMKRYSDPLLPCAADRTKSPSREVTQHVCSTLQYVWRRIPARDRRIMTADMEKYDNRRLSLWFVKDWQGEYTTNAFIKAQEDGVIAVDLAYAGLADKRHLGATLAHEFGHYRDFADDKKKLLTEERAKQYAEVSWGFTEGDVIYKCEACRYIDGVIHQEGITGSVFWDAGIGNFVYFRKGNRIHLRGHNYELLHDEPDDSLSTLLNGDLKLSFRSNSARAEYRHQIRTRQRHLAFEAKARRLDGPMFHNWKYEVKQRLVRHPRFSQLVSGILPSLNCREMWETGYSVEEMVAWCRKVLRSFGTPRGQYVA